jgi:hypothetical protein
MVQVFCEEYQKSLNQLRATQRKTISNQKAELARLDKEKANIIQAIKDELEKIAGRQDDLKNRIEHHDHEVRPLVHPSMALRYRDAISKLKKALISGEAGEAKEHVRALIEKIVLTPKEGSKDLSIDLYGSLAGILKIAKEDKLMKNPGVLTRRLEKKAVIDNILFEPSLQMVAGAGFEPTTFGL